jgi:hypothetical protein
MSEPPNLALALRLAAHGWHILPLSPANKRPLGNCPDCATENGLAGHQIRYCPCLPAGRWCHGVRAATTNPDILTAWWRAEPRAVPGIAAGPSGLTLLDIDAHDTPLPADLATGLLPGINLNNETLAPADWNEPGRYRDGRDTLQLLARLRGGPRPWPTDPVRQPLGAATPSGGAHLWYQAPAEELRQVLADPEARGRYGLAWQIDIKAGWSYGIAPGATTQTGRYEIRPGSPERPGQMPEWLARETIRAAAGGTRSCPARPLSAPADGPGPAAYLTTVISRGATELAVMTDGRKRALSELAYHAGGLLIWSGLNLTDVSSQLTRAGTVAGLKPGDAARIVNRAIANGISRPIASPANRR